ncbi:MAG: ATP-binding cassette domain-containing protein [Bacteroidales bacterium]|nr:ATP-binding cassette domain-containing protein [Bacteroidales bacterium]
MIEIQDLSFSYGKKAVLDNITLQFKRGNVYGLLGENGVGKTTMLKLICGLLRPKAGSCKVDGFVCQDRNPQMLQDMFFLPDEVPLPDSSTPERFFAEFEPFYPDSDVTILRQIAQEMHVETGRKFKQMSFGQQKKALLACAMALNTGYLFLDEPTNGLDIPSKADFRRILTQYVGGERCVIISTHQVRDVENLIDPIVIISCNKVLLNASMQRIAEKLCFEYTLAPDPAALYSEMQPNGCLNVVPNTNGKESQVNIEALFNAVLRNSETVNRIFNSMESDEERFAPKQREIV